MTNKIIFYNDCFPSFIKAGITTKSFGDFKNYASAGNLAGFLKTDVNRVITLNQKHSNIVHVVTRIPMSGKTMGDGLITGLKNTAIVVKTADCVPVMAVDRHKKIIMALHIGKIGAENFLAREAVAKMISVGAEVKNLMIVIGPHIERKCYGFDMEKMILTQLHTFGICDNQVYLKNECTLCNRNVYFSHRGGDTQRMGSFLMTI